MLLITIFSLIVLLFSIIIHEIAHGSVALRLGDPTAKYAGRLTLNPIKHIDLFGTIILPLLLVIIRSPFVIGWAKPVPINPYNFRDQKWGTLKVSVAGPAMNFLIGIIFSLINRFLPLSGEIKSNLMVSFITGHQETLFSLLQSSLLAPIFFLFIIISIYNFAWGLFNLVPIPPLDGSHVLFTFLSEKFTKIKFFLQKYSLFILIFFIFLGGLNLIFKGAFSLYFLISGSPFVI